MHEPPLILIVDDSRADALLLSTALSKAGYEVVVAHDGAAAAGLAMERHPDVILLDMTMPALDGVDVCRRIKAGGATASVPVIFVTGHSDTENVLRAFGAGGADYVTKPIRTAEILTRVSLQLRLRRAEQALVERNNRLEMLTRQLAEMNAQLARQSRIDGLTGLLNRRAWDEAAAIEEERTQRHGREYAVLLIDVDHFKQYNDSLGHPEGDRCLQQVSRAISRACRNTDVVGRYGGEEFVVLAPETQPGPAATLAERIRESVWHLAEAHPTSPAKRVTISVGVATSREGTLADALRRADEFLYRAKSAGRNIVMGRLAVEPERRAAPAPPGAADVAVAPPLSPGGATVLVGHADEKRRAFFRDCLERDGHRVTCTAGGEPTLAAAAGRPDVIVLHAGGPGLDGLECVRRLKANVDTHDVPVVLVGGDEGAIAAFDAGADDFLAEPVREVELVSRVRCMIRRGAEKRDLLRSYRLRAEQVRFLTGLVDLCQAIGGAMTVEEVCEHTLHAVEEITCCRRVAVLLTDAAQRSADVACAHGIDLALGPTRLDATHGVLGQALATDAAVVVMKRDEAGAAERRESGAAWASFLDEAPLLAAPLTGALGPVGVLVASGRAAGADFEPQAVEYVELIARVSGSALHTIRNRQERDTARDQVVAALARLSESRDDDTGRHIERVTRFACTLAEALRRKGAFAELNDEFLSDLARSVALHDIGKVAIPDAVLLKPGRLSLTEISVMRSHVEIGAETLRPLVTASPGVGFLSMALDIIRAHHEWWDGSGYPRGLMGEQIPLAARIVAVADVYDALTTDRVYRPAMPVEEARRLIREASGSQFDPRVVAAFEECADVFRAMSEQVTDAPRVATAEPRSPAGQTAPRPADARRPSAAIVRGR